ncbi:MAG: LysR family transcriptional regulator [Alphaproteobacteria bacterium]|nr:LysR family transcriptional regulator [Alphaproteobacteria bacterium]MCW5743777.1 LysR family transcriptional regulator [Alphaproteobacteria bacterium]
MDVSRLPLNALRAFEASARLGSFTRAGMELRVGQTAISHQVKALEKALDVTLFKRLPRGIALTEEAQALLPVLTDAFRRMSEKLHQLSDGNFREILTVGVVGTFATGWLIQRLPGFTAGHPDIDLRIKTNNNTADTLLDGLDFFIRFGDGAWHGTDVVHLMDAPLSPVCAPSLARGIRRPKDLLGMHLLRSYRRDDWPLWCRSAGITPPSLRGWMFDSSLALVEAAAQGAGIALVPVAMFRRDLASKRIVQPLKAATPAGSYWLTHLKTRQETASMKAFRTWILAELKAA